MQAQTIKLNPNDELARLLSQKNAAPVFVEANGVRFRVIRDMPEINLTDDPFAAYDVEKVRAGLKASAGAWPRYQSPEARNPGSPQTRYARTTRITMAYLLDSDVVIDFLEDDPDTVTRINTPLCEWRLRQNHLLYEDVSRGH